MLKSKQIMLKQSEIRQKLAELSKPGATEDEVRQVMALDTEYRSNEALLRGALIAEETERREAGAELETRSDREFADLMGRFELRQVALALDEGRALDGATAEIVQELRGAGGFRGVPVPWAALEIRNTVAGGTPDPISTRPIIDRLFPASVAARMGGQSITIESGATEWPVVTSNVTAGWAATESGNVATGAAYVTTDKPLKPDHNLGVQMRVTRKAMKQSGEALEAAIRRDMNGAMQAELDKAVFLGTGADGQPLGIITGAATYGVTVTAVDAAASWAAFRSAVTRFMTANAANGPGDIRALIRPEVWAAMDGALIAGTAVSEWERFTRNIPAANIAMSAHALAAPAGTPLATSAVLSTAAGGVSPFFIGLWGAVDVIRDPFSDAQSGGLRLTALATVDVTVARGVQLEVLTGVEV